MQRAQVSARISCARGWLESCWVRAKRGWLEAARLDQIERELSLARSGKWRTPREHAVLTELAKASSQTYLDSTYLLALQQRSFKVCGNRVRPKMSPGTLYPGTRMKLGGLASRRGGGATQTGVLFGESRFFLILYSFSFYLFIYLFIKTHFLDMLIVS